MTNRETLIPMRGADGPKQVARALVHKLPGKFWAATEAGHLLMLDENTGGISLTTNDSLQSVIEEHFDTPRLVRVEGGAKAERAPLILGRQFLTDVLGQLMLTPRQRPHGQLRAGR
jgi:hypothetical protein